jgi:hypothetical protein
MRDRLRSQRLVALCVAGGLALNAPLLTLWDRDITLAGWPLLPGALFIGWAVLIGLAAWVSEAGDAGVGADRSAPPALAPSGDRPTSPSNEGLK